MWRHGWSRVKETIEFGFNVRKSFACSQGLNNNNGAQKQQQQSDTKVQTSFSSLIPPPKAPDSKKKNDNFRQKFKFNPCKDPLIQAITWSSYLICGFYASQLLCLYRRNQRLAIDGGRCYYSKYLHRTTRSIHHRVRYLIAPSTQQQFPQAHLATALPRFECPFSKEKRDADRQKRVENEFKDFQHKSFFTRSPGFFEKRFEKFYETEDIKNDNNNSTTNLYNVNNDNKKSETLIQNDHQIKEEKQAEITSTDVPLAAELNEDEKDAIIDEAIHKMSQMVGQMEFELGIEKIMSGDFASAAEHFKLSYSHNHPGGIFNLALCYEQGLGVRKNMNTAKMLYEVAFSMGNSSAGYNLGVFYSQGLGGTSKNFDQAKKCFERAAELGSSDAADALSQLLVAAKPKPVLMIDKIPDDDFMMKDFPNRFAASAARNNMRRIAVS